MKTAIVDNSDPNSPYGLLQNMSTPESETYEQDIINPRLQNPTTENVYSGIRFAEGN